MERTTQVVIASATLALAIGTHASAFEPGWDTASPTAPRSAVLIQIKADPSSPPAPAIHAVSDSSSQDVRKYLKSKLARIENGKTTKKQVIGVFDEKQPDRIIQTEPRWLNTPDGFAQVFKKEQWIYKTLFPELSSGKECRKYSHSGFPPPHCVFRYRVYQVVITFPHDADVVENAQYQEETQY